MLDLLSLASSGILSFCSVRDVLVLYQPISVPPPPVNPEKYRLTRFNPGDVLFLSPASTPGTPENTWSIPAKERILHNLLKQ
jgi:hypothetical protein